MAARFAFCQIESQRRGFLLPLNLSNLPSVSAPPLPTIASSPPLRPLPSLPHGVIHFEGAMMEILSFSLEEESRCAVLCFAVGTKLNIHPFLLLAAFRFVGSRIEQEGCRDSEGDVDFAAADVLSSFMVRANEMDLHILNLIDFEELRDRTVVGSY